MISEKDDLKTISAKIRGKVIRMSHDKKCAHLGSALSCVDIVTALYWSAMNIDPAKPDDPLRDRFIFSKGHAAATLYAALAYKGFFPVERLDTFGDPGSLIGEHPIQGGAPGLEAASGSLGHGLPIGIGMALASRIKSLPYRVFVLMSDGECNEGSVWEAAMFAPAQKLDNLMAIVDFNKWQATGRSCEIMSIEPFKEKWRSFGWSVYEIDGHYTEILEKTLRCLPDGSGKPVAVIAHTVKGKGVSFMEDDNNWHYRIPKEEEVEESMKELGLK